MKDDKPLPIGYFMAIFCVVGGTWLIPPYPPACTYTNLVLSGLLTPVLLFWSRQYWKKHRYIKKYSFAVPPHEEAVEQYASYVKSTGYLSKTTKDDNV